MTCYISITVPILVLSHVVTKLTTTSIIGDPVITCSTNCKIAIENRRPDIARIWETCENLAREAYLFLDNAGLNENCLKHSNSNVFGSRKLKRHPMVAKMLNQIILKLVQGSTLDFQTAAMIICAFTPNRKQLKKTRYV